MGLVPARPSLRFFSYADFARAKLMHSCAMTQLAVLPGVRINTHGWRNSSTIAWILLLRPPLVSPIA